MIFSQSSKYIFFFRAASVPRPCYSTLTPKLEKKSQNSSILQKSSMKKDFLFSFSNISCAPNHPRNTWCLSIKRSSGKWQQIIIRSRNLTSHKFDSQSQQFYFLLFYKRGKCLCLWSLSDYSLFSKWICLCLFTGPRCPLGSVYGSRPLYLSRSRTFLKPCEGCQYCQCCEDLHHMYIMPNPTVLKKQMFLFGFQTKYR